MSLGVLVSVGGVDLGSVLTVFLFEYLVSQGFHNQRATGGQEALVCYSEFRNECVRFKVNDKFF